MLIVVLASVAPVLAAEPASWTECATCHGVNAQGNSDLKAPALAGQKAWYLVRQLENFATGIRGSHPEDSSGQQMRAMAESLNEAQRRVIAEYLEDLEPALTKGRRRGNLKNGYRYYQARCGACHGSEGQGNEAFQAPSLQGLSGAYLSRQIRYFRSGIRGTHPDDRYGRQMALMADTISEEQWLDILYFLGEQQ